jgi:hypothetical protein
MPHPDRSQAGGRRVADGVDQVHFNRALRVVNGRSHIGYHGSQQSRVQRRADPADPNMPKGPANVAQAESASNAETPEVSPPMLDVHPPHEALHTWKAFFIHTATIVVGLFIAVALEQSVEANNRRHERADLREELRQESRQILADARKSEGAHLEYVQTHLEEMEVAKNTARYAVRSFNREFPPLPNGDPDLSNASSEDIHTYLSLLTTAYEAIDAYIHWLHIIDGAESSIVAGKMSLNEIYASERKLGAGEFLRNFM